MKLISWNVNGIRAIARKGFFDFIKDERPDILCIQETKAQEGQLGFDLKHVEEYKVSFHSAKRKGYSGVATYSSKTASSIETSFGSKEFDDEGRVLIHKYKEFSLYNIYFPNGKASKARLDYKMKFYEAFLKHVELKIQKGEKIIICGDVNTAHHPIDLARPKQNEKTSGFLPTERAWIDDFLKAGFVDSFRALHPKTTKYSWWSMRTRARDRNVGWRIDYFYISKNLKSRLKKADILTDVIGSDHAPLLLEINL